MKQMSEVKKMTVINLIFKPFRQVYRYIRDGLKSIYHHLFMAISSVMTLMITLSLVTTFVLFAQNTSGLTKQLEGEIKVFVELDKELQEEESLQVVEHVEGLSGVAAVEYHTKEEGYQEFIDRMSSDDPELAAFFEETSDENPLPDSLVVSAMSIDQVDEVAKEISDLEGIAYVDYGEESTLSSFANITGTIRQIFLVISIVLLVLAVFLIQNTIKLTIMSRKNELKVMRLVGASSLYVTAPFLVEGLVIGIFGAAIPVLVTIHGYQWLYEAFNGQLVIPMLQMVQPFPTVYELSFLIIIMSIVISFIGSLLAVSKYAVKL